MSTACPGVQSLIAMLLTIKARFLVSVLPSAGTSEGFRLPSGDTNVMVFFPAFILTCKMIGF